jgi:hypothetical protein
MEQRGDERRFSDRVVARNRNVSKLRSRRDFHGRGLYSGAMTAVSCFAIGLGFVIAVGLLVFAGIVIGWLIPHPRRRRLKPREPPDPGSPRSD